MSLLNALKAWLHYRRVYRHQRWLHKHRVVVPKPSKDCKRRGPEAVP